ncbi:MAG: MATE family efflux transporter [Fibrobacterales bacterium]
MSRTLPDLTTTPVGKSLASMTLPMIVGIGGMILFNLIDTWFVAQLGPLHLAAMSFTFPITLFAGGLALGLGTGATAVISRAIGTKDTAKVNRTTVDALLLSLIIVSLFILIGFLTMDPLFRLLGSESDTIHLVKDYMTIWYGGALFVVVPMVGNSAIRATGDIKTTSAIMMIAIVINFILDPLLIFGYGPFPRMEMEGAALASVIARATTFIASLLVLRYKHKMLTFIRPTFQELVQSWKGILYIGLPSATTKLIIPISMGVVTRMVAQYGTNAVAGFGVASRIEALAIMVFMALSAVTVPFTGQNFGAGHFVRIKEAALKSSLFALIYGFALFLLFFSAGESIAALFDNTPSIVAVTNLYLFIVSLSYGLAGILMVNSSTFNGLNQPMPTLYLAIVRMVAFYIPFAYIGSHLFGLAGICIGIALANALTGAWAHFWLKQTLNRLIKT